MKVPFVIQRHEGSLAYTFTLYRDNTVRCIATDLCIKVQKASLVNPYELLALGVSDPKDRICVYSALLWDVTQGSAQTVGRNA